MFKNDNIQLKLDSASKVKIIQRGKGTVEKEIKPTRANAQKATSTYTMCSGKLVKFKDTRLEAIQLTQAGSRGKLLITFDRERGPVIRFHKVKSLKQIQQHDFGSGNPLDYLFSDLMETTRIELKQELENQPQMPERPALKTVIYYAGHILALYRTGSLVDVYKWNGPRVLMIELQDVVPS